MGRVDRQQQEANASPHKLRNWSVIVLVALFSCVTGLAIAQTAQEVRELLEWGDNAIALERADQGLEKTPGDAELQFYHALALARTGKKEEALEEFKALAMQYPDHPEVHNNLAVLYALDGNYDKARAALEAALGTHEAYATAHKNLGDIYSAQAADAYNRALARDEQRSTPKPELNMLSKWETPVSTAQTAGISAVPAGDTRTGSSPAKASPAPVAVKTVEAPVATETKPETRPLKLISTAPTVKAAEARTEIKPLPEPTPEPAVTKKSETETAKVTAKAEITPVEPRTATKPDAVKKIDAIADIITAAETAGGTVSYRDAPEKSKNGTAAKSTAKPVEQAPAPVASPNKTEVAKSAPVIAPKHAEDAAKAVEKWAAAWSAKNVNAYIASYASFFRPESGQSHAAWAKERRSRVSSPKYIRVGLRNLRIRLKGESRAVANFQQDYQSDTYQDSVKKVLYLEKIKGSWLIVREVTE